MSNLSVIFKGTSNLNSFVLTFNTGSLRFNLCIWPGFDSKLGLWNELVGPTLGHCLKLPPHNGDHQEVGNV